MKKIKKMSTRSSAASEKKKWPLMDYLSFLDDTIKHEKKYVKVETRSKVISTF